MITQRSDAGTVATVLRKSGKTMFAVAAASAINIPVAAAIAHSPYLLCAITATATAAGFAARINFAGRSLDEIASNISPAVPPVDARYLTSDRARRQLKEPIPNLVLALVVLTGCAVFGNAGPIGTMSIAAGIAALAGWLASTVMSCALIRTIEPAPVDDGR